MRGQREGTGGRPLKEKIPCDAPNWMGLIVQPGIWCLVWPSVIGGCRLDRVTKEGLINSADWVVEDVSYDMKPHMMMPRVYGRLVKPQAA